ncbi:hypothetical protein GCM10027098_10370 [Bowmanella dokdonensis]
MSADICDRELLLLERFRQQCIQELKLAYQQAGMLGLCAEGRFEAAISAIESLNCAILLTDQGPDNNQGTGSD